MFYCDAIRKGTIYTRTLNLGCQSFDSGYFNVWLLHGYRW